MSKQDLREAYGELVWARYEAMKASVKADLGAQGIAGGELKGLEIEDAWDEGEVVKWTVIVALKDGRRIVYEQSAAGGAQLTRDGAPVVVPVKN
jgi:hypothetical protein